MHVERECITKPTPSVRALLTFPSHLLRFFSFSLFIILICFLLFLLPAFDFCATSAAFPAMDIQEAQHLLSEYLHELANLFNRLPGSAIFLRYVKSSYQNDPIRSAVELFLFLFAVRYLLAPKYSTKPNVVQLSEDEVDDLVDEWTPEPLVGKPTPLEEMEVEKRAVIVG